MGHNIKQNERIVLAALRPMLQLTHTHTHPFNGHLSGTTRISQYQKGKTNLDFTEAFKARLDKFWKHQSVKFDFTADLTGTGNRSEEVIK